MRHALRAVLATALGSLLLAGCSGAISSKADEASATPAASWGADPAPAPGAGRLGGAGTPCVLPVSFDLATSWKASSIADGVVAQGGFALRCEVDAKPGGHIGFLRVWVRTPGGTDPAHALDSFLAGQPGTLGRQTRPTKAGPLPAAESTYLTTNAELAVRRQERLLAVDTPKGTVIFSLGGVSLDEHRQLLPAYVLMRQTVAAS